MTGVTCALAAGLKLLFDGLREVEAGGGMSPTGVRTAAPAPDRAVRVEARRLTVDWNVGLVAR